MSAPEEPEFSRLIGVNNIEGGGHTFSVEANAEERNALARRFRALSIECLVARGTLTRGADHSRIHVHAHLQAEVSQQCVVSLATVVQRIDVDFFRQYGTDTSDEWSSVDDGSHEIFLNLDSDDLPDPIVGGNIDVGEAVAEQLALELNPFPRAPGAKLDKLALGSGQTHDQIEPSNLFAALATVKDKLKKRE